MISVEPMEMAIKEILESEKHQGDILAIFLTGSRLKNLETENSDYDFYCITRTSEEDIIFNRRNSIEFPLKSVAGEVKSMSLHAFALLLYKSSPNILHLFFKDPLYLHADFFEFDAFLYNNLHRLFQLNKDRLFGSIAGQMKNDMKYMENNMDKTNSAEFRKHFREFALLGYQTFYIHKMISIEDVNIEDIEEAFIVGETSKIRDIQEGNFYSEGDPMTEGQRIERFIKIFYNRAEDLKRLYHDQEVDIELWKEIVKQVSQIPKRD